MFRRVTSRRGGLRCLALAMFKSCRMKLLWLFLRLGCDVVLRGGRENCIAPPVDVLFFFWVRQDWSREDGKVLIATSSPIRENVTACSFKNGF